MTAIPEFILRKLIVPGSLHSTVDGFSFALRNSFAPGNLTAFIIDVDSHIIPPSSIALSVDGHSSRLASCITIEDPYPLTMGLTVTVQIQGTKPGKKIFLKADTKEIGPIDFSFSWQGKKPKAQRKPHYSLMKKWTARPLSAQVSVDCESVIGNIHPHLYGHFIEHLERCIYDGIWTADGKSLRQDTNKLISDLQPSIIRYPGGNFASGYHWQDGIGPKQDRPQRFDAAWQAAESNQVGTDEYMDFVHQVGCDPLLVVNDGSGTAQEAANWVAYCNEPTTGEWGKVRAANGHPDPHQVKIWGVGNEVWGAWQIGTTSAEKYSQRLVEFIQAMRKKDPTIKIVAVGNDPLTDSPDDPAAKWNEIILAKAGRQIDYLSWHIYQPDQSAWQEEPDAEKLHHIVCAAPLDVERIIQRVNSQISKFQGKKPILQALDEWNLWLTPPEDAKSMHNLVYTMRDALYSAGMLNVFHRQCNSLGMTNIAQLVNVLPLIVTTPTSAFPTAMYFPFLMYTKMESIALQVHSQSPGFESQQMGMNISAHRDVPYLDMTATTNTDHSHLVLGLINRHPYNPLEVSIQTKGWVSLAATKATSLFAEPLAANTIQNPNQLRIVEMEKPIVTSGTVHGKIPPCSVNIWEFETR